MLSCGHDMRVELAELHRRIGATSVFVTHDQVEAMTLADRILILNKGHIEQFDTPKDSSPSGFRLRRPTIGSPPMNILQVEGDGSVLRLADGQSVANYSGKGKFQLGIRPEDIVVNAGGPTGRRKSVIAKTSARTKFWKRRSPSRT